MFVVAEDPNKLGNGDICIRTDKGTLVVLVYAKHTLEPRSDVADVIVAALNAAFAPSHTDLLVSPESLDALLEAYPLPDEA